LSDIGCPIFIMKIEYPFIPKSSRSLRPGDFWGFKLKNDTWACGRILQLPSSGRNSRMWLFGALLDWNGENAPTSESIANAKALRQGAMHIDAIRKTGLQVIANRPLEADQLEPWLCISGDKVQRGYVYVRPWKREDTDKLPTFSYWGDLFIWMLANHHFSGVSPADDEFPSLP